MSRNSQKLKTEISRISFITPSAVERFGLFTIIVLGEVIVGVVQGVAEHHHLDWLVGLKAALGMMIAIGLWWLYFDFVSLRQPIAKLSKMIWWTYLHLPMTIGMAAIGAAILNVMENSGEHLPATVQWLLLGAIAAVLLSIALLMQTISVPKQYQKIYRTGGIITATSSLVVLTLGWFNLSIIILLIAFVTFMLLPIFYGIMVWIRTLEGLEGLKH